MNYKIYASMFVVAMILCQAQVTVAEDAVSPKIKPEGFKEIRLIDDGRMPPLPQNGPKEYVVFVRNYLDLVYPASKPRAGEIKSQLTGFATLGEYEPLTFSIHALQDLKNVKIVISELTGPDGHVIPSTNIDLRYVRCLDRRVAYQLKEYMNIPTFLSPFETVNIPANSSLRFWLTLKVPEDAIGGKYHGKVVIQPENATASTVDVEFEVLPFKLKTPKGIAWGVYYHIYCAADPKFEQDVLATPQMVDADVKDMKEHGMTSIAPVGSRLELPVGAFEINDGKVTVNLFGDSLFEQMVKSCKAYGLNEPIYLCCSNNDPAHRFTVKTYSFKSKEYADTYKAVALALKEYSEKEGWPELIWQPVDECESSSKRMSDARYLLKLLKEVPVKTCSDNWGAFFMEKVAWKDLDWLVYNGQFGKQGSVKRAHDAGKKVFTYNNDVENYRAEIMRSCAGYYLWKTQLDGFYNWEYRAKYGQGTFYDDIAGSVMAHSYPDEGSEKGGPSVGWEAFREGIDDYKYLYTLAEEIKSAHDSGIPDAVAKADEAKKILIQIEESLKFPPKSLANSASPYQLRDRAEWKVSKTLSAGEKVVEGPLKIDNGWDFNTYDKNRKIVANLIIELRKLQEKKAILQNKN